VKSAEFPPFYQASAYTPDGTTQLYPGYSTGTTGTLITSGATGTISIAGTSSEAYPLYFLLEIDGLNRSDETSVGGNRSALVDSVFAKFQLPEAGVSNPVIYNENSGQSILQNYLPPVARVDRLKIITRLHTQSNGQYIFWPNRNYGLTLEIETMENSFDNFSSMETRLR
jgi:hypothetical protein